MSQDRTTPDGSTVHRYDGDGTEFTPPEHYSPHIEQIEEILSPILGANYHVIHEIVSDQVHIDILVYPPTAERNNWTLVTSGMSDRDMSVPDDIGDEVQYARAELMLALPGDWFHSNEEGMIREERDEWEKYWPIELLTFLARFPHKFETWLWDGHSIPHGDPAKPYADNTRFTGAVIYRALSLPTDEVQFVTKNGETVTFLSVIPVYSDEMTLKLNQGADALAQLLESAGVTDLVDINRQSVVPKGGLFRWFKG